MATTSLTSVRDLITRALRRMRVIGAGETPSASDLEDGHSTLNELIDSLGLAPLAKYHDSRTLFPLVAGKGTPANPYTLGPGGDVVMPRPVAIDRMAFLDVLLTVPQEYPLTLLTPEAYQTIGQKSLTSPMPGSAYYEPTFPLGSLYLWMVPTRPGLQGVIYSLVPIPEFTDTADLVALPPGYQMMLRDQLVLQLWPEYHADPIDPAFQLQARETLSSIKVANVRPTDLTLDAAWVSGSEGWYDITTDSGGR